MGKTKIVLDADVVIDFKDANGITYVTFLDLVWYAWRNGVMTEEECNSCIQDAISAGNKVPNIPITQHIPTISNL